MAFDHYEQIWNDPPESHTDLVVLLCLAKYADKDTGKCWPSVHTIAELTRLTKRCVYLCLGRLSKAGYVIIDSGGGKKKRSNFYFLKLPRDVNTVHPLVNDVHPSGEYSSPPDELRSPTGEPGSLIPVNDVHPNKSVEQSKNKAGNKSGNKKKKKLSAAALQSSSFLPASPEEPGGELNGSLNRSGVRSNPGYAFKKGKSQGNVNGSQNHAGNVHQDEVDRERWSSPGSEPKWMQGKAFNEMFKLWVSHMEQLGTKMSTQRVLSERRKLQPLGLDNAMCCLEDCIERGGSCLLPDNYIELRF